MITSPELEFREYDHSFSYKSQGLVSVTNVLTSVGMIDFSHVPEQLLDRAKSRGSNVHLACYLDDSNDLDFENMDPGLKGYVMAWRKFRADTGIVSFEFREKPIGNVKMGLAGIPDCVALLTNKQWAVIEIKTNTVPAFAGHQLALYEVLLDKPCKRFAVALKADGRPNVKEFKDRDDRGRALGAPAIHRWKVENGHLPKK